MKISILSASVRKNRNSHRVALFFHRFISEKKLADCDIIDLAAYDFPVFHERLRLLENPPAGAIEFAARITAADAIIIVTPEYNGGYPASLKNVTDLLYMEWKHKPIGIAMVSEGPFGGAQVITSLLFTLWKIGALMVPAMFPVPAVTHNYDETGLPTDRDAVEKRAGVFVNEVIWCAHAVAKMK